MVQAALAVQAVQAAQAVRDKLDEIYHSKDGAKKEAFEKFIEPCLKIENFTLKPLKILDI